MQAFQKGVQATLKAFGTKLDQGLSEKQVEKSRREHGKNVFVAEKKTSLAKKILLSLKDVATIILLIAAGISFVATYLEGSNNYFESLLVIGIVVINSALSIFQEGKAESSLAALKDLNKSQVKVFRNGQPELIDSDDVVVGDLLLLENGRSIAADARLIEAVELQTEESALTGESLPVEKDADATFKGDGNVDLGERVTMVYRGTTVVNGHGLAIVTAVGMATEMGKIASLLNNENSTPLTPLQRRLAQLGRNISYLAIISAAVVLTLGIAQGMDLKHIFLTAISLAVAIVPETLPVIVTMTLALGVQRIAKKHAIIRRLPAVETLGTTNVIASDKTGTLTQNKMTVRQVWQANQNQLSAIADGLPGFALSREPMLTDVMDKAPMPKNSSLFSQGLGRQIALNASLFALVTLGAIWFGQNVAMGGLATSEEVGQTMAFVVLSLTSIMHVFNIRSEKSLFSIRYDANPSLVNMALLATLITVAVSIIPGVQGLFGLVGLSASHWLLIVLLTVIPTIVLEILKKISPRLFQV
ncbi:cation-translocating P-type ATPase [Fructobacillus americanaquae]|uniref:Cation-translocating P-type ATPase n=1 Tax=Fructobacillus americanaquae TaxID=2940302 RepID=A0ABY5C3H8_9LACO|nr:cation-translocating P-type ATPase [Fructobacillus americanaquae]USS92148.1 cation-translocating P-type ATPase [Fructobacillus americanaquae]